MPTVFKADDLCFDVYSPDHPPPHVHVFSGWVEAVIRITDHQLMYPSKMKKKQLQQAFRIIQEQQAFFLAQ